MRVVSTRVLPVPAPASTSSGPPSWTTAWRCSSFSPSRWALGTTARRCGCGSAGAGSSVISNGSAGGAMQRHIAIGSARRLSLTSGGCAGAVRAGVEVADGPRVERFGERLGWSCPDRPGGRRSAAARRFQSAAGGGRRAPGRGRPQDHRPQGPPLGPDAGHRARGPRRPDQRRRADRHHRLPDHGGRYRHHHRHRRQRVGRLHRRLRLRKRLRPGPHRAADPAEAHARSAIPTRWSCAARPMSRAWAARRRRSRSRSPAAASSPATGNTCSTTRSSPCRPIRCGAARP